MHYTDLQDCSPTRFKRLTGVSQETFHEILAALHQNLRAFGRAPALSRADQLVLTLMYFREYRTQRHIAQTYQISESAVCRTIHKVEKALLASDSFRLPGKKALLRAKVQPGQPDGPADGSPQAVETVEANDVVVVDATESPVERPKKGSASTTAARRSGTPRRHR
jgi:hypothetical protein